MQRKLLSIEHQQKIILLTACPYDTDPNLIKDAAVALQAIRPELSADLTTYSQTNEELIKATTVIATKDSTEETKKIKPEVIIKLIKNSAVALYTTRPDLAAKLIKYAEWQELKFNMNTEDKVSAERDRFEEKPAK